MADRRTTAYTIAIVLHQRRAAERQAQQHLALSLLHLEGAIQREAQAAEALRRAEQALAALAAAEAGPAAQAAQALRLREEAVRRHREEVRGLSQAHREARERVAWLGRQAEEVRGALLRAIARREAAELHEATDRRERTRGRVRRAESQEEEAVARRRPG